MRWKYQTEKKKNAQMIKFSYFIMKAKMMMIRTGFHGDYEQESTAKRKKKNKSIWPQVHKSDRVQEANGQAVKWGGLIMTTPGRNVIKDITPDASLNPRSEVLFSRLLANR